MTRSRLAPLRRLTAPVALGLAGISLIAVVLVLTGTSVPVGLSSEQPQETASETPTPSATEGAPELVEARVTSYEVFLARDPFEPVIPEAAPAGAAGAPTTSPTTAPTTSPTTAPTTSPTASPSPSVGGCVTNETVSCDGQTVSLVDVFTEDGVARAVVQVNEVLYEVASGDVFAQNYRVLSIEAPCVTLQYGDDRFSLCEGESVLK